MAILMTAALATPAFAQSAPQSGATHVVPTETLNATVAAKAATAREQREAITRVLDRANVQAAARSMGLDVKKASNAVAELSGDDLARAAATANRIDADLAGGASTVIISTTTLLLLLILIVLIVD
jgi:hypothetical protein